ncbi:DUF6461 domain-containing protein, partial [Streptomyces sp. NPDC059233]
MSDGLQWIAEANFDHYCATFAKGLEPEELVRRMGGDPAAITEPMPLDDAVQLDGGDGLVAMVGSDQGWAFALELQSMEGDDEDIIVAVSRDTDVVVLTKSFSAPSMFRLFREGRPVAYFEVRDLDENAVKGDDPAAIIPAMKRAGILLPDGLSAEPDDADL